MEAYGTKNSTEYIKNALVFNTFDIDLVAEPPLGPELIINGYNGNRYSINLYEEISYIQLTNFQSGQEIKLVCVNKASIPVLLVISGDDEIKWHKNFLPKINANSNAIITFEKINNIVYSDIKKDYVGTSGSGSDCGEDNDYVIGNMDKIIVSNTEPCNPKTNDIWIQP